MSFTPGLFWLWFFLRLDKLRPEPRRLIALTFLLGCVATIPAGILELVFLADDLMESAPDLFSVAAAMLLVVGPVEELCKFGAVRLGAYRSLYFDEPVDGLVYAAAASLGFASLENLLYVLSYGPAVMVVRAPLSTVAHLAFGSIWGYALGQHYDSGGQRQFLLIGSLALAAAVHALFNVTVFAFPLASLALGAFWSMRAFRWGQRVSPFRYRRNYPRVACPQCGAGVVLLHRFCISCGALMSSVHQVLICSHCREPNRPDATFCTSCGDQLLKRPSQG